DDLHAKIHRVADGLLLVVEIRERDRRLAVPDRDRADVLDFFQRAGQLLRCHSAGDAGHQQAQEYSGKQLHLNLLLTKAARGLALEFAGTTRVGGGEASSAASVAIRQTLV